MLAGREDLAQSDHVAEDAAFRVGVRGDESFEDFPEVRIVGCLHGVSLCRVSGSCLKFKHSPLPVTIS